MIFITSSTRGIIEYYETQMAALLALQSGPCDPDEILTVCYSNAGETVTLHRRADR